MGCGASTDNGTKAQAPVASSKPKSGADAAPGSTSEPVAPPPPLVRIGSTEWHQLQYVTDLAQVLQGVSPPNYYLAVHDNKKPGTPRLTVVSLADGTLSEVRIKDKGRGLATAMDLESLFMIDAKVAGKKQPLYVAMTSAGLAFLFKVSYKRKQWVAHGVKAFNVCPPPGERTENTNCEGSRAFVENGVLYLEYGNRGGLGPNGEKLHPWVARTPLDIKAIRKGRFELDPAALDVTFFPETVDNDPAVRQCADLGQAVGHARYGQLFAAAKDDEANEIAFVSYIMERLPGAQSGGVENCKPLFKIDGAKIEAIYDISKDVSIFATDDEGKGSFLTVLHRHSGLAWKKQVIPIDGGDPRLFGISGMSPVDIAIKKKKDDSSSESEESEQEEEEEERAGSDRGNGDGGDGFFGGGGDDD